MEKCRRVVEMKEMKEMYDLILKKEKKNLNNDDDEILRKGGFVE